MKRKGSFKNGKEKAKGKKKKPVISKIKEKVKKKPDMKVSKSSAKPKSVHAKKTAVKKHAAKKPAAATPPSKPESKIRISRPKSFPESPVVRESGFPAEAPELPKEYHRDQLVLMTQKPDYLFGYWEITPELLAVKERKKHKGEKYREAMKLNWRARSLFEDNYAILPVSLEARRWYVRVPFSGISYQVEIGWLGSRGHFISILDSNETETPESWDATCQRLKEAGGLLSHVSRVLKPMGSSQPIRTETPDLNIQPSSTFQTRRGAGKSKNKSSTT
jgi:hypothetical protein